MAINADMINTVSRDTVVRFVEFHIDNQLSDADWVAANRRCDAEGRDYWTVEVRVQTVTEVEVSVLTTMYKNSGWDNLTVTKYYRDITNFTLYKAANKHSSESK